MALPGVAEIGKSKELKIVPKKLCGDVVKEALRSIGRWPMSRPPSPYDFTEEERFRMFKAVMHGNIWPAPDIIDYAGRLAFRWTYSVAEWRRRGRRKFAKLVREAAAKELAEADYSAYDLSPLRCLIGDDGGRFRRLLRAADAAEMEQRMNGMEADLAVIDRKTNAFRRTPEAFGELKYRINLYDNSYEAVIHGGKGGWPWTTIMPWQQQTTKIR